MLLWSVGDQLSDGMLPICTTLSASLGYLEEKIGRGHVVVELRAASFMALPDDLPYISQLHPAFRQDQNHEP